MGWRIVRSALVLFLLTGLCGCAVRSTKKGEFNTRGSTPDALLPTERQWVPPDIDEGVPSVSLGVTCPVREVVNGVSLRAKELLDNLQQYSATERIEHVKIDKAGNRGRSQSATFKYVVEIRDSEHGFLVDEYRNGSSNEGFLAHMATRGTTVLALMFHPTGIDNLTITCEGLGSVRGQPAWQLYFAQRANRPTRFHRMYVTNSGAFSLELKGRAWVAPDSYQIMRVETDLAKPVNAIALKKDHIIVDYRPVEFPQRHMQLWLPDTADLYTDFLHQRSHRHFSYSSFELFWVETVENRREPELR